jgi:hypothetical protein
MNQITTTTQFSLIRLLHHYGPIFSTLKVRRDSEFSKTHNTDHNKNKDNTRKYLKKIEMKDDDKLKTLQFDIIPKDSFYYMNHRED